MFTLLLCKRLATTNLIESSFRLRASLLEACQ